MAQGDFWSDQTHANQTIQSLKVLKAQRDLVKQFERGLRDLTDLLGLIEADDHASLGHLTQELAVLEAQYGQLVIKRLLGGGVDS